jgi:pilus assembly protein CpaC
LLVIITPEIVGPIPGGQPVPEIRFRNPFLPATTDAPLAQPATGAPPLHAPLDSIPIELLTQAPKKTVAAK